MLVWLADFSGTIPLLNVFRYITFRAGGATVTEWGSTGARAVREVGSGGGLGMRSGGAARRSGNGGRR